MGWKWRWNAKTEASVPDTGMEATCHSNGTEITLPRTPPGTVIQRSIRQFPHLVPADASAEAFVDWMRANGGVGKHLQGDLYDAYRLLCNASNVPPLSDKKFGREMIRAGCERKQLDFKDAGGARSKPWGIYIPLEVETEASGAEIGRTIMGWETPKGPSRKRTARMKRAETKRKLVASM